VAALAAFSPWTDLSLGGASVRENAIGDPLLDPGNLRASAAAYLGSAAPDDPSASPLFGDMDDLPPLLIQVGTDEILLDDSRRFAAAVEKAGGTVQLEVAGNAPRLPTQHRAARKRTTCPGHRRRVLVPSPRVHDRADLGDVLWSAHGLQVAVDLASGHRCHVRKSSEFGPRSSCLALAG